MFAPGMNVVDLRRQLASTVLRTKKSLAGARAGQFRTIYRGSGSDFDQLSDYQPGDDIRFIDWKSSARTQRLVLRQYRDERSRNMIIALDSSASMNYGTGALSALEAAFHVALVLAIVAEVAGDAVGLYQLRDRPVCLLPSAVGQKQTEALVELGVQYGIGQGTFSFIPGLRQLGEQLRHKSLLFLISDFSDETDFLSALIPLSERHACCAIRMRDGNELLALEGSRSMKLTSLERADRGRSENSLELGSWHGVVTAQRAVNLFFSRQSELFKRAHVPLIDCFFADEKNIVPLILRELQKIFG